MNVQSLMKDQGKTVSIKTLCRISRFPHASFYYKPKSPRKGWDCDRELEREIKNVIDEEPTWGLRHICAVVRARLAKPINRKKIHRIIKHNDWQAVKRPTGKRPRAHGMISRIDTMNTRWAIDATHIMCGRDGWCHLTAIIDCCNREIVGYRFSQRGIAKIAAGALEDALIYRGITKEHQLTLRSDNGLVFGSKVFKSAVGKCSVAQEYITPYTPEQNGMIERFFKTLKEECVWKYNFKSFEQAQRIVDEWIHRYNTQRPHSALGYTPPVTFSTKIVA